MNTIHEQLVKINNERYPFIRRDKQVRARVLADLGENYLIEATYGRAEPCRRVISKNNFENNFWEGID
jgi:hypothetical protein